MLETTLHKAAWSVEIVKKVLLDDLKKRGFPDFSIEKTHIEDRL